MFIISIYYDSYVAEREMAKSGVGWFKFDEASGNVTDSKGTAIGTATGATRVDGWNGEGAALSFDGTSNYVAFNQKVLPTDKFSIRFKIKCNIPATTGIVLSTQQSESFDNGLRITIDASGRIAMRVGGGTSYVYAPPLVKFVADGKWHDVLITWGGLLDNILRFFVDGIEVPEYSLPITGSFSHALNLTLGKVAGVNATFFNGQIDELEIYNDVINPHSNKSFILLADNYKKYESGLWSDVSSTVPALEQFQNEGMEISNLNRSPQIAETQTMIDNGILGEGRLFKGTVDLSKYFDLRKLEVK